MRTFLCHPRTRPSYIVSLLLVVVGLQTGFSQTHHFENFTLDHGLPSSQVYDIFQDKNGYMWFATDCGISRYNGYEFKNFGISDGLPDLAVLHFFPQGDGKVWCTTHNYSLFYFDPDNPAFIPFRFNNLLKEIPQSAILNELLILPDQTVLLSPVNRSGFYSIDTAGRMESHFAQAPGTSPIMLINGRKGDAYITFRTSRTDSLHLYFDDHEVTDISHHKKYGITRSVPLDRKVVFTLGNYTVIKNKGQKDKYINTMEFSIGVGPYDPNHFWVGILNGGVNIYSKEGAITYSYLPGESVTDVCFDHENGLWISTLSSGVFYLKCTHFQKKYHLPNANNCVRSIVADKKNVVYASYFDGRVIEYKNGRSSEWARSHNGLASIQHHPSFDRILAIVDYTTVYGSHSPTYPPITNSVLNIADDMYLPSLLLIGVEFFIEMFNDHTIKTSKVGLRVNDIQSAHDGGFYIGSLNGLYFYNNEQLTEMKYKNGLFSYRVEDIDRLGQTYYMATKGAGVVVFKDDTAFNIDRSRGLYSNMTSEVYIENDSTVWVCSNAGLNRITFSGNGYAVDGISDVDGLINKEVNDVKIVNDTVWAGTRSGICTFPVSFLEAKKKHSNLFLSLTKTVVNDENRTLKNLSSLSHSENRITINYQGISFKNTGQIEYRYQLIGLDSNWHYTNARTAHFSSLAPGNYQFVLQARGKGQEWSHNELSLPINIDPPYYVAWWFKAAVLIAISLIVYLFSKVSILTYNRDIAREVLRYLLKKIRGEQKHIVFREPGQHIKIESSSIQFVRSAGNYLEIFTTGEKFVVRGKISEFLRTTPDPIEFMRVHRSYIVRLDKVDRKDRKNITIGHHIIPFGKTYKPDIQQILL